MSNEAVTVEIPESAPAEQPERAAPITSRFLFVDVAARRAKQLRRGARPRVELPPDQPAKPERLAMREVELGLIPYTLPPAKSPGAGTPDLEG